MRAKAVVIGLVALAIALIPFVLSDYHRSQGADVAVYAMAILGLNVVTGYTGQISIGHGAFMALGGYTTAILTHDHGWNDIATLPIALIVGFVAGVIVGVPALRFHGAYLALLTFAFALAVPQVAKNYSHFTGGTEGLALPTHSGLWLYGVGWACVALI
jgi:branched-chain amino acid transport system permease protein